MVRTFVGLPSTLVSYRLLDFSTAAVELGLVSDFLHRYGNGYDRYPTMEFKHDLGIILFSCVVTFLYVLSHPWSNHFSAYSLTLPRL